MIKWAIANIPIPSIIKNLLLPTLSISNPKGALKHAAKIYVIIVAFPADTSV